METETDAIPELRSEFAHTAAECRKWISRLTRPASAQAEAALAAKRGLTVDEFRAGRQNALNYWRANLSAIVREC